MKSKKTYTVLLVLAALLILTPSNEAYANLLSNAGFEDWIMYQGKEVPSDWTHMFNYGSVSGTKESTVKRNGGYSGKMERAGRNDRGWGGWLQEGPFTAGQTLYAKQAVNIPRDLVSMRVRLRLDFLDSSGNSVLPRNQITVLDGVTDATNGWEFLTKTSVAPANTAKFQYTVLFESAGPSSRSDIVYLDDAYAGTTPVPEPATILLFGSGLLGILMIPKKK